MDAGLDLDEVRIVDLFPIFEVQLAREDPVRTIRVVERHSEFVAHQRPELVDRTHALLESGARQACSSQKPVFYIFAGAALNRLPHISSETLHPLRNLGRFDFTDREYVITAVAATRTAVDSVAVEFTVAGEFGIHSGDNFAISILYHLAPILTSRRAIHWFWDEFPLPPGNMQRGV